MTKTVSTQKVGQVLDASHYLLVNGSPVNIRNIEGEVNSTTGTSYYIQLHGSIPATGVTVPLYSRLCVTSLSPSGVNGFSFTYPEGLSTAAMSYPEAAATGGLNSLPVYVAISSTDNVYTAVAANTQVSVDFEAQVDALANTIITGDTTTGVDNLTVFTDPNATKRLVQAEVTNNTGAVGYLMLFAQANPANGTLPLQQWKIANGATLKLGFAGGIPVQSMDATLALHTGCYLFGSSTTQTLTKTVATGWKMKGWNI